MQKEGEKCKVCGQGVIKKSIRGNLYCSFIHWQKEPWKEQERLAKLEHESLMDFHHGDWGNRD